MMKYKMTTNSRENEVQAKQEAGSGSSRLWSTLENRRIVRASRLFGGKDRHSKVTTIRGLRDRRVRLSVPTAIQLYDLQDKLGLNQPSKVVDWLLNAAQHEIDKLPPLQMPPGDFIQFAKSMAISHEVNPSQAFIHPSTVEKIEYISDTISHPLTLSSTVRNNEIFSNNAFGEELAVGPKPTCWNSVDLLRAKQEEAARQWSAKKDMIQGNEVGNQDVGILSEPVSDNVSINGLGHFSCPGILSNAIAYTSYSQSEPSNAYNSHFHSSQAEATDNYHSGLLPPSLSLMPSSQQARRPSVNIPLMFSSFTAGSTNFHAN